ncbi:MAG TPA: GspH/FimT family pseudopilin [Candidatus Acidoferrales bacterium]|jgi:Tfp pilus assembly protein FimT|nr:GspH/FimT family pseudopilin [Candidatus Acidoferrales bacterium]
MRGVERRKHTGFSAIELVGGISLLAIVMGFAVVTMDGARPGIQANGAMNQVVAQLHAARDMAMAERRSYQIRFTPPGQIQLRRLGVHSGFTDLPYVSLGNAAQFTLFAGLPDTPEGFGNSEAVSFGNTTTLTFLSNGRMVDSHGALLNGTVFLGIPGQPETARAVTIAGATGHVTAYYWTGSGWEE